MILAPGTTLTGIRLSKTDGTYAVYRGLSICKFIHSGLNSKLPKLGPTCLVEWLDD